MQPQKLDETRLDMLKELANIGTGNAATSLSEMLYEEKVTMDVPAAIIVQLQDVPGILGGAENPVAGVYIKASGDINLAILFVLPLKSAANLISSLLPGFAGGFDELGLSALEEVGNILIASYLNALSFMTNFQLTPTPPEVAIDMAGAIITTIMVETNMAEEEVVLLKTRLNTLKSQIEGNIFIFPDRGDLDKIFTLMDIR